MPDSCVELAHDTSLRGEHDSLLLRVTMVVAAQMQDTVHQQKTYLPPQTLAETHGTSSGHSYADDHIAECIAEGESLPHSWAGKQRES